MQVEHQRATMFPGIDFLTVIIEISFTLMFPTILSENPPDYTAQTKATLAVNSPSKIETKGNTVQNHRQVRSMRGISERIQQKLFESYSKADVPDLDNPTELKLGIYVNSFDSIHKSDMSYKLHLYLRQKWFDPRLKFDSETIQSWNDSMFSELPDSSFPTAITFLPNYIKKMFLPDVFLR